MVDLLHSIFDIFAKWLIVLMGMCAVLALIPALIPEESASQRARRWRRASAISACALGFVTMILTGYSDDKAADERRGYENEIKSLNKSLLEQQQELIARTEEIVDLAKELTQRSDELARANASLTRTTETTLSSVTGGSTYPRIFASTIDDRQVLLAIHTVGDYPLYDVSVAVIDLEKLQAANKAGKPDSIQQAIERRGVASRNITIGTLTRDDGRMLMILEHGGRPTVNINVATSARNGNFVELIRLRRNALGWTRAVRCYRKGSKDLLFEEVAADFPREPDGSVDWEPYD